MNRLALLAVFLTLMSGPALAGGSTAQPVQLGSLTTSGCPSAALTPCFKPYSSINPLPISTTGGSSISLTTTGTSGASTLVGSVLNIPIYSVGGGSTSLSAITSATGTNTIDNANFAQTWNWSTLGGNTGLSFVGTTTGAGKAFSSTITGASNTGYAGYFSNTATTGYALYVNGTCVGCTSMNSIYYTTTNRTIAASDVNNLLTYNNTAAGSWAIPAAGTTGFTAPNSSVYISNMNSGALTVTSTPSLFNGLSGTTTSFALQQYQWAYCIPDISNNYDCVGNLSSSSGGGTLGSSATNASPSVSGDATTGLYSAGAGKVNISASGTKVAEFSLSASSIITGNGALTVSTTGSPVMIVTSSSTSGAFVYLNSTQSNGKQIGIASGLNSTNTSGLDIYGITTNDNMAFFADRGALATYQHLPPSSVYGFTSGNVVTTALDTGLSRDAAGVVDVGTGAQGSTSGRVKASGYMSAGTKFTASGCSNGTTVGGATAGKFTLGANTCSVTVTMGDVATAPNGWACRANDLTAPTVLISATTGGSTTTCVLSVPAGAGATDVVEFSATGY